MARDPVSEILGGNKKTFRKFYRETQSKLLAWITREVACHEDAEEIVQDTYLAFLDSLPLYRGTSSLWTFLTAIARHELADYWRKRYAKKAILTIPFADHVYHEKLFSARQVNQVVDKVYAELLPDHAKILKMKYEQGLSIKAIAHDLNLSFKATESRLFRARRAFQLAYEGTT